MTSSKSNLVIICVVLISAAFAFFLVDRDIPPDVLKAKYAGTASKFIDIDGIKVHYRDQGSGPTLLCIHGIFASLHTWDGWVKELSGKYRLITLDLPPFGLTGPANFEYTRENYIKFLKKLIDKLGITDVYLAGNSLGGYLAWSYAAAYPEQVKKLILIDAAGYRFSPPFPIQILTTPFIGYFTKWIMPKFVFAYSVREVYGNPDNIKNGVVDRYYELMMHPGNREATRLLFYELKKLISADPVDINKITAPTLIMWGNKDKWIPVESAKRFNEDIKNSRLIIYNDAGHISMEEFPSLSAADADSFLSMQD